MEVKKGGERKGDGSLGSTFNNYLITHRQTCRRKTKCTDHNTRNVHKSQKHTHTYTHNTQNSFNRMSSYTINMKNFFELHGIFRSVESCITNESKVDDVRCS